MQLSQKEYPMDKLTKILDSFDQPKTKTKSKRKWREIEQLKEKFELERELKLYEDSLEYMLDEV